MCDADDKQSKCAQGCIPPSFDKDANVVTEDEKASENEVVELISEMEFEMEMMLDYGSTDGKSLDDVASEIADTFKPVYEKANPFDEGITTVNVEIQVNDESGSAGNRKRRSTVSPVAKLYTGYKPINSGSIPNTPSIQQSLFERIQQAIKNLGNTAEHLSDEQLCDYASKSLNKGLSYIRQAISSSENFMKMKGIQTKKASSADKLNLSKWMDSLPEHIKKLPLTLLAIPGTHQSGTASFKRELVSYRKYPWDKCEGNHLREYDLSNTIRVIEYVPNEEELPTFLAQTYKEWFNYQEVQKFYARDEHLGQDNKPWKRKHPDNEFKYLEAWSTCQRSSIKEQLLMGVRYFDFRYDSKQGSASQRCPGCPDVSLALEFLRHRWLVVSRTTGKTGHQCPDIWDIVSIF